MRFTTPAQKAIVVIVLLGVDVALTLLLDALRSEAGAIVLCVLQFAGWYLATRVFRDPGEPVRRARPWWRMTNKAPLSGLFGALYAVAAVVNLWFSFTGYASLSGAVSVLVEVALAALFLTSFARLRTLAPLRA